MSSNLLPYILSTETILRKSSEHRWNTVVTKYSTDLIWFVFDMMTFQDWIEVHRIGVNRNCEDFGRYGILIPILARYMHLLYTKSSPHWALFNLSPVKTVCLGSLPVNAISSACENVMTFRTKPGKSAETLTTLPSLSLQLCAKIWVELSLSESLA